MVGLLLGVLASVAIGGLVVLLCCESTRQGRALEAAEHEDWQRTGFNGRQL